MPRSAPLVCLLSTLTCTLAAQGYSTDFETFTFNPGVGTPCAGQDGFYVPAVAGSIDGAIHLYPLNPLGVPQNPNGGAVFYAGQSVAGQFARSQRNVTLPNGLVRIEFDVLCNYLGTITPVNNIGSFSFQDSPTSIYVNLLARWPVGVAFPPTTWNADVVAGSGAPPGTLTTVLADPAFQNLDLNVWHRWGVTIDLVAGVHVSFSITNGTTGVTTEHVPATPLLLPTAAVGAPLPTDFRFFTGGNENLFAIDNFTITYAADYATFGQGCPGALGVPTLALAPGSEPQLGSTMTINLGNLPVSTAVMISGLSNTTVGGSVPLPLDLGSLGFPGCDLLVDPLVTDVVVGAGNTASWQLAIPAVPSLAGLVIYNQAASLDPGAAFLSFSNGGAATLGL